MFERLERGWDTVTESLAVLWEDKELLVFPCLSCLASLLVCGSFIWPLWSTGYAKTVIDQPENWRAPLHWAILFVFYAVNYFVTLFFNSALVACAIIRLRGGDPSVSDGFRAALGRLPQIVFWALVSATVGVALKAAESKSKRGGELVSSVIGIVWSVATFFVVPILVIEGVGPIDAIRRSSKIISEKWGESFIADLGVGLVAFLAAIPGLVICAMGGFALSRGDQSQGLLLVAAGVLILILVSIASSAAEVIALTVLYLEAADEKAVRKFERRLLRE